MTGASFDLSDQGTVDAKETVNMGVEIKKDTYGKYGSVLKISNGKIKMMATLNIGPRIIHFSIEDKGNMLADALDAHVEHDRGNWHIYGGHRLWHGPEAIPRSYMPDNGPVNYEEDKDALVLRPEAEPYTQIQKEIRIKPTKDGAKVTHLLTNGNAWPVELTVCAITACAKNGTLIVPLAKEQSGLAPNRILTFWPYSNAADPRFTLDKDYLMLRQDPNAAAPFKAGVNNEEGWTAYLANGSLFVKKYQHVPNAKYPDCGVSTEAYTTDWGMEVGTLSPLTMVQPGETAMHEEQWHLIPADKLSTGDPDGIAQAADAL
jgi:hypothetical protein